MDRRPIAVPQAVAAGARDVRLPHRVHRGEERRQHATDTGLIEVVERSPGHAFRDAVATALVVTDLDHVRYAQRGRTPALGESILLEVVAPLVEAHDVGAPVLFEGECRRPEAAG